MAQHNATGGHDANGEEPIRILLIDDSSDDTRLIRDALSGVRGAAFRLEYADRLSIALARLSMRGVDVVLLDLSLPDCQGLETLIKVHDQAPDVPVIVVTGMEDESLAVQTLQKGAQDYLAKRFVHVDPAFLVRAIRYAIQRKRAEEELTRLASFAERNPSPIVETSAAGRVTYLNPAARAKFPELASGYLRHPATEGLDGIVDALRRDEQESFTREIVVGRYIYEQRISYVPESDLVRSYLLDITERKQVEHLKDEFLSTVSHELRTPLATIKEFIAIIADQIAGPLTADQTHYLTIIKTNIDRLARMISDVLDMAKIESGHVVLNKTVVQAGPLIEQVIQSIRPLAEGKQVDLLLEAPAVLPDLFADADKVTQVLINLVGNAIKFTSSPGKIILSVEELESEIRFRVADTGIGIDPKDLPRLFDKFQQFRRMSGGSGSKGTGLGLAISKRFVELHGGRIWAESQPGVGSTFYFTLPRYHVGEIFRDYLKMALAKATQSRSPLSIATVAVDECAELKARGGAEVMASVLAAIERRIRDDVRLSANDLVVRWQSGEMLLILSDGDKAAIRGLAQRVKEAVERQPFRLDEREETLTVAVDSVSFPEETLEESEFLRMVEERLQTAGHAQLRLLIVDDEPKIRQFLKELLEIHAFQVVTAASGPEALDLLKTTSVDLILLDIMMPVMDGYEVYHLLKENAKTRDIPVLIVTAQGERVDRLLGMSSTSYNYVTKPFEPDALVVKIRELLQHRAPRAVRRGA